MPHPVRVGIDGVDCAGKTTLADELEVLLRSGLQDVIRCSIDRFHNPREIRYRQGRSSPRGFYEDSFNLDAVLSSLLRPLGPEGTFRYLDRCFDYKSESEENGRVARGCAWQYAALRWYLPPSTRAEVMS